MIKIDPIIAVKDVEASTAWYQQVFELKRAHGESESFAVLMSEKDEVMLCLHAWEADDHPTMRNSAITPGNGLILYFKTDKMDDIRQNVEKTGTLIEEDIHVNPNSTKREFSLRDPDGYFLTVTEYHIY
jgi:predicted enzyme related to lactoylglutathione lyase